MSGLMDAPVYDEQRERRKTALLIAAGVLVVLLAILFVAGFIAGHGWFFSNLPANNRSYTAGGISVTWGGLR